MSSSRAPEPLSPRTVLSTEPPREDRPQTTMFSLTSKSSSNNTKARDPVRTILVFAAVVAPLAILPYFLVRRHLTGLRTELKALRTANTKLAKELQRVKWDIDNGFGGVQRHVDATVEREGTKLGKMLQQAEWRAQERDGMGRAWEDEMRKSVGVLLSENLARRTRLAEELKGIGHSLADTAAFVQEVEMRQGWVPRPDDGRGIERTRRLAVRLLEDADSMEKQQGGPPQADNRVEESQPH
ncbi:hypothetical protein TRAPUB_5567 [Trametes pubescens]|uniref:Uncharacterized protein n=1 Tax=Trametes pubescens TaxID=154538 RepID=A0A1M2V849_TRAPU|nr:hypothetical protein TRAPUB_5567 [Trametes pubescens]